MSIKNLFGRKSVRSTETTTENKLSDEIESLEFAIEKTKERERFVPDVDFEDPSQFARYGSAKKYYNDAINNINKTYPYDGSFKEKTKWHNDATDLVNYIYENKYPRNTGFITIGKEYGNDLSTISGYNQPENVEYISFNGTMNTDESSTTLKDKFVLSNKLDLEKGRFYNLNLNGEDGATVEFYLFKENHLGSTKQVVFDLWNNSSFGSVDYGRFKIETRATNQFVVDIMSGSQGISLENIGIDLDFTNSWHHYAIAFKNEGSAIKLQLFVDGDLNQERVVGSSIGQVYGTMTGQIGGILAPGPSATGVTRGCGKLSGSLDEFRYWKRKRTDKEIYLNHFTSVGAGSNTDESNTDLGVYFKFNEGIYSPSLISNYDKIVLDYSGRISNGNWIGYTIGSRNEGSGLELSNNTTKEEPDPIVYPDHYLVLQLKNEYEEIADLYDRENITSMYDSLPGWIAEEDEQSGEGIKELMQVMSEFFDDLYVKIEYLPTIKNLEYSDSKPIPFASRMVSGLGFELEEIFSDSTLLEIFSNRSEVENYEEKIYNIKNFIYKNIYNNLLYIYRSKGTEKSFRNLLRCFGIDDELVKLNLYADNVDYALEDRFNYRTEKKKYVDFNNVDRFDSTVFQEEDPSNPNSIGYISGSSDLKYLGTTIEAEAIFPKKFGQEEQFYFKTDFVSASIFGLHESEDGTWTNPDRASVQVFAVRDFEESDSVKFKLSSSYFGVDIDSALFKETYNNQKWNLALRIKHEKYPQVGTFSGSTSGDYVIELYGTNCIQDIKQESFLLTASVGSSLAEGFYEANKKLFVGAHRTNYTGSVVVGPGNNPEQFNDTKISSVRFWHSYLDDQIIDLHAKDVLNYGPDSPYANVDSFTNLGKVNQLDTLALHWDFSNVSSSDNGTGISTIDDGEFVVEDFSSGSIQFHDDHPIARLTEFQFTGKGSNFPRNSADVVQNEFVYSAKRRLPETLNNDDLIKILQRDDEFFSRDTIPVNHYFAIEKSMYQIISEDMLRIFGTVKDFNNIIGRPHYRYESSYREMQKLKEMYFRNVQNKPDFNKFVEFYKWVDDSVSRILEQLIPASMNYKSGIANIIESHILERNKYRHKLPTIEFKGEPPLGPARSVNELLYNWKTGHAPLSGLQKNNCDWWLDRSERDSDRQGIFDATVSALNRKFSTVYNLKTDLTPIVYDKKRETEIIRNEVGFDISGTNYYEINDLLAIFKDCDD